MTKNQAKKLYKKEGSYGQRRQWQKARVRGKTPFNFPENQSNIKKSDNENTQKNYRRRVNRNSSQIAVRQQSSTGE